jgi:hypothetical protein
MTNEGLLRERVAKLRCRAGGETYAMVGGVAEARIKHHRRPRGTNNPAVILQGRLSRFSYTGIPTCAKLQSR